MSTGLHNCSKNDDLDNCANDLLEKTSNAEEIVHITASNIVMPETTKRRRCGPFFGISYAILSSLTLVVMNLFAKLCKQIPVFEIGIVRFMIQLAITIPPLIYANEKIVFSPRVMIVLFLRGFTGTSGMLTRFYAVQNMPLGDATVLMFTTPVFVAIFGRIILKEPLHRIYIFLLLLCLAGTTLIARPSFIFGHPDTSPEYDNVWLPSLVALCSAMVTGLSMVLVRVLGRDCITSSVIIFYFGLVGLIYSICGSYLDQGFQFPFCKSIEYVYVLLIGIFAYLVQLSLNAALKFEKAFIVALGRTSGIVFGFVVQVLVFSLLPRNLSFGGTALIAFCNFIIFFFKWQQSKKNSDA